MSDEKKEAQGLQESAEGKSEISATQKLPTTTGGVPESSDAKESEDRSQANNPSSIEEARELVSRMEKENAEYKKLLDRHEKLMADSLLAGKGVAVKSEPKEETPQEYARRKWAGR